MIKAKITFEGGAEIRLTLDPDAAPDTVANFVDLAKSGFYTGLCMHRVIPGFMIQGGGMIYADGMLGQKEAPRSVRGEFTANGFSNPIPHKRGVISMARTSDPDSASSQFFICVEDCPYLDGQYAAFGKTADDESTLTAIEISKLPTRSVGWYDDVPVTPVVISSVEVGEEED